MTDTQVTTQLLIDASQGSRTALDQLLPQVYDELRRVAEAQLRNERAGHTLAPTALVHEAYIRLIAQDRVVWQNRAHFFALAAQAIRRILIDHARQRQARKRGGDWGRITLAGLPSDTPDDQVDLLALEEGLAELANLHERQARVVELRFFGGLTEAEVAEVLGVHRSTVADDWALARAWLSRRLAEPTS